MKKTYARTHKIGKRERIKLESELIEVKHKLNLLDRYDDEGFQFFYHDPEKNEKIVQRKFWLEEVLTRGTYVIVKEI